MAGPVFVLGTESTTSLQYLSEYDFIISHRLPRLRTYMYNFTLFLPLRKKNPTKRNPDWGDRMKG